MSFIASLSTLLSSSVSLEDMMGVHSFKTLELSCSTLEQLEMRKLVLFHLPLTSPFSLRISTFGGVANMREMGCEDEERREREYREVGSSPGSRGRMAPQLRLQIGWDPLDDIGMSLRVSGQSTLGLSRWSSSKVSNLIGARQ